jgi:hypothetical protein
MRCCVRWLLILLVLVGASLAAWLKADTPQRFWMRDHSALGTTQSAYLVQDRNGGEYRCVLVVQTSWNGRVALTSQPWPCK